MDKKEVAAAKAAAAPTLPAAPKPAAAPAARRGDLAVPTGEAKVEDFGFGHGGSFQRSG